MEDDHQLQNQLMVWLPMHPSHLPDVISVSDVVHGEFTEELAVYQQRYALYSSGCRVLIRKGKLVGYLISHPWQSGAPPKLNQMVTTIPPDANIYYLHDIALQADSRGQGMAAEAVNFVMEHARQTGFSIVALVALGDAVSYWHAQGFKPVQNADLKDSLAAYGEGARYMEYDL